MEGWKKAGLMKAGMVCCDWKRFIIVLYAEVETIRRQPELKTDYKAPETAAGNTSYCVCEDVCPVCLMSLFMVPSAGSDT